MDFHVSDKLVENRKALAALQEKLRAYQHAMSLLSYDGATAAPRGTARGRAQTLAALSGEVYVLKTSSETEALLDVLLENDAALTVAERRAVAVLEKDLRRIRRVPIEEYMAQQRLLSTADSVWHEAKEKSDFSLFAPVLSEVFATRKRMAQLCEPDMDPYDYCLDQYEEGVDRAYCDHFFATFRSRIVPLLGNIREKPQLPGEILSGEFSMEGQRRLALRVMDLLGLDRAHVGLSTTEHPFTTWLGGHEDVRLTTHYYESDFSRSLFSVLHEGGHALYASNVSDELLGTVLDAGASMGIHESQSRFYENIIGRSLPFCTWILPVLQELFPSLSGAGPEDLYRAVNRVEPGLIRIQADELTYSLHVMIRYELEKAVFSGELSVSELPGEWNRLVRETLGLAVPDDRSGVLQDSHWSTGYMGYFPTYALGSAYGAQYLRRMRETVDVDACVLRGELGPVNDWLRERVWRHGKLLTPGEVFLRAAEEPFSPEVYADYLEEKFSALYDL